MPLDVRQRVRRTGADGAGPTEIARAPGTRPRHRRKVREHGGPVARAAARAREGEARDRSVRRLGPRGARRVPPRLRESSAIRRGGPATDSSRRGATPDPMRRSAGSCESGGRRGGRRLAMATPGPTGRRGPCRTPAAASLPWSRAGAPGPSRPRPRPGNRGRGTAWQRGARGRSVSARGSPGSSSSLAGCRARWRPATRPRPVGCPSGGRPSRGCPRGRGPATASGRGSATPARETRGGPPGTPSASLAGTSSSRFRPSRPWPGPTRGRTSAASASTPPPVTSPGSPRRRRSPSISRR